MAQDTTCSSSGDGGGGGKLEVVTDVAAAHLPDDAPPAVALRTLIEYIRATTVDGEKVDRCAAFICLDGQRKNNRISIAADAAATSTFENLIVE